MSSSSAKGYGLIQIIGEDNIFEASFGVYRELGADYLDKLQSHRLTHYLVKRLQSLGHQVTLSPLDQAA